ncbi:MAG TPA: hypothetical protein VG269_11770 [Tepidisphaeraceae bacterium]|nr:hypothetical protein [Tepidisphaeraceae bacterium]
MRTPTSFSRRSIVGWIGVIPRRTTLHSSIFAGTFDKGSNQYLLLNGFAAPLRRAVDRDAVDFAAFSTGMAMCKARKQVYFLDACRSTPAVAINTGGQLGSQFTQIQFDQLPDGVRHWLAIYSSAESEKSFGMAGAPSVFTEALIECLRSAAWDDMDGPWESWNVNSDTLSTFIARLLEFRSKLRGLPVQTPMRWGSGNRLVIHRPKDGERPTVPLLVGCDQSDHNPMATFEIARDGNVVTSRAPPVADDWEVSLPAYPEYIVTGKNGANTVQKKISLRPACVTARLTL